MAVHFVFEVYLVTEQFEFEDDFKIEHERSWLLGNNLVDIIYDSVLLDHRTPACHVRLHPLRASAFNDILDNLAHVEAY